MGSPAEIAVGRVTPSTMTPATGTTGYQPGAQVLWTTSASAPKPISAPAAIASDSVSRMVFHCTTSGDKAVNITTPTARTRARMVSTRSHNIDGATTHAATLNASRAATRPGFVGTTAYRSCVPQPARV